MSNYPLVSIVTPSLNHAPFIVQTLESVLDQDYPNIEHIVVDGGSTDGTIDILRNYSDRYPGKFRWISQPDEASRTLLTKAWPWHSADYRLAKL